MAYPKKFADPVSVCMQAERLDRDMIAKQGMVQSDGLALWAMLAYEKAIAAGQPLSEADNARYQELKARFLSVISSLFGQTATRQETLSPPEPEPVVKNDLDAVSDIADRLLRDDDVVALHNRARNSLDIYAEELEGLERANPKLAAEMAAAVEQDWIDDPVEAFAKYITARALCIRAGNVWSDPAGAGADASALSVVS